MTTEEKYLALLEQAKTPSDPKAWHGYAESIMLNLLREAGFNDFADEYEQQSENWWYT